MRLSYLYVWHVLWQLAGFRLEVVKTTSAGHARNLASSVDISTCPDGKIIALYSEHVLIIFCYHLMFPHIYHFSGVSFRNYLCWWWWDNQWGQHIILMIQWLILCTGFLMKNTNFFVFYRQKSLSYVFCVWIISYLGLIEKCWLPFLSTPVTQGFFHYHIVW